jgi:MerR family transcriptional regulator, copper efflux regulator
VTGGGRAVAGRASGAGDAEMRIGDAAAALGVTTRALRYYEQRGLVTARRAPSGHREYADDDVERLRTVRLLLESGLTIEDVRDMFQLLESAPRAADGADRCPGREVVLRRMAELDQRIARLTELRGRLARRIEDRFEGVFPEGPTAVPASADRPGHEPARAAVRVPG